MRHIVNASEITIKQGKKTLLSKVSFAIQDQDKVVIVGRNGTGKTTLMTILAQENEIDEGDLIYATGLKIGYLPQEFSLPLDQSIHEVLQNEYKKYHLGVWSENHEIQELEKVFKLPPESTLIKHLSGGQHRRVALLKALLLEPDLLLLDEPTNHLDLEMIKALEKIIHNYPKACVLISHDRYFVDQTANKILEIDNQQIHTHRGGFSDYLYSRETRLSNLEKAEEKRQEFLKREREWVVSGVKARGTKNKGRMKRYQEVKKQETFRRRIDPNLLIPEPPVLGSKVLKGINLHIDIAGQHILKDFNFKFEEGYKVGLIGPNGSGKTTFLRTITGELPPTRGKVVIGESTIINYQDQSRSDIDFTKSIMQEVCGGADRIEFGYGSVNSYAYLKRFLFSSQQIRESAFNLSGGERARVLLAKLFRISSNFLILDEPTNDLDIETLNVLESSLRDFPGCMIVVSHDRYFLNNICTHILSLEGDGSYILSTGNYDDFIQKYKSEANPLQEESTDEPAPKEAKPRPEKINESENKLTDQERRKLKKELNRLTGQIAKLESQIQDKEAKFADPEFFKRENLDNFMFSLGRDKKQLELWETRFLEISDIID